MSYLQYYDPTLVINKLEDVEGVDRAAGGGQVSCEVRLPGILQHNIQYNTTII